MWRRERTGETASRWCETGQMSGCEGNREEVKKEREEEKVEKCETEGRGVQAVQTNKTIPTCGMTVSVAVFTCEADR